MSETPQQVNLEEIKLKLQELFKQIEERYRTPKVRAVESGEIELRELSGLDLIRQHVSKDDFDKFKQAISNDVELRKFYIGLMATAMQAQTIENAKVDLVNGKKMITLMKRNIYGISKLGWLIMCMPVLADDCPSKIADFLVAVANAYPEVKKQICST